MQISVVKRFAVNQKIIACVKSKNFSNVVFPYIYFVVVSRVFVFASFVCTCEEHLMQQKFKQRHRDKSFKIHMRVFLKIRFLRSITATSIEIKTIGTITLF